MSAATSRGAARTAPASDPGADPHFVLGYLVSGFEQLATAHTCEHPGPCQQCRTISRCLAMFGAYDQRRTDDS